jgi:hypothetical protein
MSEMIFDELDGNSEQARHHQADHQDDPAG